ncbi:hypothetical protein LINPERHAP2_LOCUS31090 [Linum perenne]
MFMIIQLLQAINHGFILITARERPPPRILLKAVTEMPSESGALLFIGQNLGTTREDVLVSILPARISTSQFIPSLLYQSFVVHRTIHGEIGHRHPRKGVSTVI